MQLKTLSIENSKTINSTNVSVPKSLYADKIFDAKVDIDKSFYLSNSCEGSLIQMLNKSHPLISTWLVLSSASICLLFALFFVIY